MIRTVDVIEGVRAALIFAGWLFGLAGAVTVGTLAFATYIGVVVW
jgi:hypothetical protein